MTSPTDELARPDSTAARRRAVGERPRTRAAVVARTLPVAARPETREAFPRLPRSVLVEMARGLEQGSFDRGEVIVREGDAADRFFLIESGQVEATQAAPDGEMHVKTMVGGDFFGEVANARDRNADGYGAGGQRGPGALLRLSEFQALVGASQPTARDLADVVSTRNVKAQPRADRAPLPSWTGA